MKGGFVMPYSPGSFNYPLVFWGDPDSMVVENINGVNCVTKWKNKASTGGNYNFIFKNAAQPPAYKDSSDLNGFPAMVFGKANQYLEMATTGLGLAKNVSGLTMALVFKPTYPTSDAATVLWVSAGNDPGLPRFGYSILSDGTRVAQITRRDSSSDYGYLEEEGKPPAKGAYWDIMRMDYAKDQVSMFNSGLLIQRNTPISSAGNTADSNSKAITLGALPNGSSPAQMQLAEMLIWRGPIAPRFIGETSRYINDKYFQYNNPTTDYYIYAGDSNVEGLGIDENQHIQFQVQKFIPAVSGIKNVSFNYALGGLKISETVAYMESEYLFSGIFFPNARNIFMVLGSGTNDIWAGVEPSKILASYKNAVNTFQNNPNGIKVFPWTTLPMVEDFREQCNELVQLMKDHWQACGWNGLISANSSVLPPPSVDFQSDNAHLTSNGLPSTIGVGKVAKVVAQTLRASSTTISFLEQDSSQLNV
jgi:hypothetical protein